MTKLAMYDRSSVGMGWTVSSVIAECPSARALTRPSLLQTWLNFDHSKSSIEMEVGEQWVNMQGKHSGILNEDRYGFLCQVHELKEYTQNKIAKLVLNQMAKLSM
jgi:hypothetical protein